MTHILYIYPYPYSYPYPHRPLSHIHCSLTCCVMDEHNIVTNARDRVSRGLLVQLCSFSDSMVSVYVCVYTHTHLAIMITTIIHITCAAHHSP
ncbi:hypothetical protein EON63_19830 [archaeon]|nr:MAG: hypothetical protein EON63_19830 [archaeon]